MNFSYSELIEKFKDVLGTPKELMEETFNKPDAVDIVKNRYVSIKKFRNLSGDFDGDFYIITISESYDTSVRFLNAYRIYPNMLNDVVQNDDGVNVDTTEISKISEMRPLDVLKGFMNRYGLAKAIPGFGERRIFVEKNVDVFFFGILDIEKYLRDVRQSFNYYWPL